MTIRATLLGILSSLLLASSGQAQEGLSPLGRNRTGLRTNLSNPGARTAGGSGLPLYAQASTISMGEIYTKAHHYLQVSKTARAANDLPKAVRYLDKIAALPFPQDAKARRFLGSVLCNRVVLLKSQGKWQDAEKAADHGLSLLDVANLPATYHVMLLHSMRGEILGQLGKKAQARAAMAKAEELELQLDAK